MNDSHSTIFVVIISAEGAKSTAGHCIALPVQRDMINKPLQFFTEDPDNVNILFENFRNSASNDKGVQPSPLLKSLQRVLAPNRESPISDCTVPILENGTMTYIGSVTFSNFDSHAIPIPISTSETVARILEGRLYSNCGASRIRCQFYSARKNPQIGGNTVQSFLTATSLGASCVKFGLCSSHIP